MDWYKRYMGDYMRDTANLSLAERGAYDALLDQYYVTEAPLPKDKRELYRIVRAFERWERAAVDRVLAKFFTLTDAGYENPRADEELAKYKKAADIHRANGRRHITNLHPNSNLKPVEIPDTRYQIKEKSKTIGAKTAPRDRATTFPEGFVPNQWHAEVAKSWGVANVGDEWALFENKHRSKGSRFVNWDRAWVTWCIQSRKFNTRISDDAVRREAMGGSHYGG